MQNAITFGLLAAAACLMAACGTAYDDPQPWCSIQGITGSQQCFYRTREECQATISGLGGICVQNPEFMDQFAPPKRKRRSGSN